MPISPYPGALLSISTYRRRRLASLLLVLGLLLPMTGGPARSQTPTGCFNSSDSEIEEAGPTDISAVSGNQRLAVGVNEDATVTVFKWPSPSFYDQIKMRTTDRSEPRMGALPNEGAFVGIAWRKEEGWGFNWLREWKSNQRFISASSDSIITTFRKRKLGLTVSVSDVVAAYNDSLVRLVSVKRSTSSPIRKVRVIAFSNYNPVVSKIRGAPVADWCTEERNDSGASYLDRADLTLHTRSGIDESTGTARQVALATGFVGRSDAHHVGMDTYETAGPGNSAYDDASDGKLSGGSLASGQADAAMADELKLGRSRRAGTTILMTAAPDQETAVAQIDTMREAGYRSTAREKAQYWRLWLDGLKIPDAPRNIEQLALRALISIRQATDANSGLIVTSVATQTPLGVDNIRHGAYINRALDRAGHPEMVERHNFRYAELQARVDSKPPGGEATPNGNWSESYYADGVVGGTRPYEIDATGFGIWTLWDHYALTGDREYLMSSSVYEAIQRAAQYLSDDAPIGCRDPSTGLQCTANEEDSSNPTRTLRGAQAVWLGLDSAAKAARLRGGPTAIANAEKWEARRDEIGAAIEEFFYSEECNCYTSDYKTGGTLLWPVGYLDDIPVRADVQAEINFRHVARAMAGKETSGGMESRALLGNAYAWASDAEGERKLKRALAWVASVPTTDDTKILGGAWSRFPNEEGPVTTMLSQPHVWDQAMFYLAALKTYGSKTWGN